ncbi:sporulation inhibitor of replication protein SirA [Lentibacillus sp. N15]|uniref:sporulation inhibitor of replication protein SirA n=1 Tax=Lentibacillus songyuanensis TaxID=3136161 RepID=UPI0031B9EC5D
MGHYSVYWIKKEFAHRYFHKSGILYRFFKEYKNNPECVNLQKQYHFITNSFSPASLVTHLRYNLEHQHTLIDHDTYVDISGEGSHIALHMYEKQINFRCETLHDAEDLLFPALRSFYPFLFTIRNDWGNYGWIAPIPSESAHLHGQVLYS